MKMVNTTSNASGKQSYPMWEEGVADSLADKLGISYSDAQGIILSNEFYMAQAWAKGMNEEQTADLIDKKSTSMAKGGGVGKENFDMVRSQNKAISHHTKELNSQLNKGKNTPAWVVSKVSRASNDLSDVTHYLDGETMAKGGGVRSYEIYHKTLASALEEVEDWAARNGYTFTSEHYFPDVTIGGVNYGETKRFKREVKKDGKNKEGDIAIQVYRMDSGTYELNLYPTFEKGGMMAKGGSLKNSNVNVTNEMRGEDSDEYGTFEIYKDGGNIEVSIINSGQSYDRDRYEWLLGDFDKDGLSNSNDNKPLNKRQHEPIDSPNIAVGLEKLIALKKSLDSNMYSFVEELKNVAPDKSKIYARTKTPYSILDKLVKKRLGTLTDLIGTTIVTNDKKELDAVKRFVESGKLGRVTELEDMYEKPKQGYRAYHFLIDRNGTSIELQLKTKRQKAINELSHEPYKQGKLDGDKLVKMTELANRADEGDKAAIKQYNDFMEQPNIENVFYAERGGYMAKGGGIDKTLISSIPKRRRADRKYTHFAVRKSDNKILNGWDYSKYDSAELNADKYHYFYYDMNDMDVSKNDYTIKKAQTLIREGINPFDFNNWKNLDFSNDKMAQGGGIKVESFNEENHSSFYDYLKNEIEKNFGSVNSYSGSADWGGIDVWTIVGDDYEGTFLGIDDNQNLFLLERKFDEQEEENIDNEIMTAESDNPEEIKAIFMKAKELQGKTSMAHGGEIEVGDWVAARKGNARGQVYDIDAVGIKLQDKYGNQSNTRYLKSQLKHSSKPRYEDGGTMEVNEVLSFFNNIDYSKLPPAFSDYIKKEILTDDDLQYLSPREPIFLEIKGKVEGYSSKPTTQTTTQAPIETGVSDEKKKVIKEIADLEGLKDLVSGDELNKINKELDDLNGLLPIL